MGLISFCYSDFEVLRLTPIIVASSSNNTYRSTYIMYLYFGIIFFETFLRRATLFHLFGQYKCQPAACVRHDGYGRLF